MSVSELVRDLLDQALAKSEERRLDRIYKAMEQVKGACKDNVSDASVTIDEILYGERGAWREDEQ